MTFDSRMEFLVFLAELRLLRYGLHTLARLPLRQVGFLVNIWIRVSLILTVTTKVGFFTFRVFSSRLRMSTAA